MLTFYFSRVFVKDDNLRKQAKFVVFLPQLMELFNNCPTCNMPGVLVEVKKFGTMVHIETTCNHRKCNKRINVWTSQPRIIMPKSSIPAGNLLLSFAILTGGGSASKTLRIFEHMGLGSISLSTFHRHQRVCTFDVFTLNHVKSFTYCLFKLTH